MNASLKLTSVAVAAAFATNVAKADSPFGEHVRLSGFGTLGIVQTNNGETQYRAELTQARGASNKPDVGVDSKLGLQVDAQFNDTFSAVGQLLVSRRLGHTAALEWLYGSAKLPAGFELKLGRIVLPTFMVSDSRNVGYASHWVRAPQDLYSTYPASSFDGGQLSYREALGPVNLTVQASAGSAEALLSASGTAQPVEMKHLLSVNVLGEMGDWLLRIGQTRADTRFPELSFIPVEADRFTGVGLQFDNGRALFMAEYITRRQDVMEMFDSDAWYLTGGWRFGDFTPYAVVSRFKPRGPIFGGSTDSHTEAIGLRWNARANLAVKAQLQTASANSGAYVNPTPAFLANPSRVKVLSLALDFVF